MDEAELAILRRAFAKQMLCNVAVADPRLEKALAELKREDFLNPGPWQLFRFPAGYYRTPTDDPLYLYQDLPVAILPEKSLNNGQPSYLVSLISFGRLTLGEHAVHIGAGLGYYTAVIARLVGMNGRVTAIEYEPVLASRAAENLKTYPCVRVVQGDGTTIALEPADVIYVNAGVAGPAETWLDALKDGGRMILPMATRFITADGHTMTEGGIFRIERMGGEFWARWMSPTSIYPCLGMCDAGEEAMLAAAFKKGGFKKVTRLYRRQDIPDERCWFKTSRWSLAYH